MLLSNLKKLLHPTSRKVSPREEKSSEEICVQSNDIIAESAPEVESVPEVAAQPTTESDTRSHLTSSVPRVVSTPEGVMTRQEMREARDIFIGLDDTEIQRLYKKVTQ